MFSLRTHIFIFLGLLAAVILLGILGNLLAAAGFQPQLDQAQLPLRVLFLGLVMAMAFAFVPVMVLAVTGFQTRIGNDKVPTVGLVVRRRAAIVWALWALLAAGIGVALPAAIRDGFLTDGGTAPAVPLPPSEGTLVAAPGLSIAEMRTQSTLKLQASDASGAPLMGGGVFDLRIAGTDTVLRNCRYYFVSTLSKDPSRIEALSIGTSPSKLPKAALATADAVLGRQLLTDGWRPGHETYETAENQQLHEGATTGPEGRYWLKNGIILHVDSRRMDDPAAGEDPASAGEWIQFVDLWQEADFPNRKFLAFPPGP